MVLALELALSLGLVGVVAPAAPDIVHEPLPCVSPALNPAIDAVIQGADIRTVKVYFRSDKYPKFYYVEMQPAANGFVSVLPKPSPETASIIYYIEAVDVTFSNATGVEYTAVVSEDCVQADREEPPQGEPEIIVGATEAGAAALPPGFQTAGIVGTITAAGVGTIVGGGSGIGTAAVVGGVAAGVGGAVATTVVLAEPSVDEPNPDPSVADSAPSAPRPAPTPTPTPAPPTPPTTPGSPTPPPAPEPPPDDDAPAPPPPPTSMACFTVSFPGMSCNMKLDATCSTGGIASYEWEIAASASLGGVTHDMGASVNRNFPSCAGESVDVTLTVTDGSGGTHTSARSVTLPISLTTSSRGGAARRVMLITHLDVRPLDGAFRGAVESNGSTTVSIRNTAPARFELDGRAGKNVLAVSLVSEVSRDVLWVVDFSATERFIPGSLRALHGSVLALEPRKVVFRLSGASGEQVRFQYQLAPRD